MACLRCPFARVIYPGSPKSSKAQLLQFGHSYFFAFQLKKSPQLGSSALRYSVNFLNRARRRLHLLAVGLSGVGAFAKSGTGGRLRSSSCQTVMTSSRLGDRPAGARSLAIVWIVSSTPSPSARLYRPSCPSSRSATGRRRKARPLTPDSGLRNAPFTLRLYQKETRTRPLPEGRSVDLVGVFAWPKRSLSLTTIRRSAV